MPGLRQETEPVRQEGMGTHDNTQAKELGHGLLGREGALRQGNDRAGFGSE